MTALILGYLVRASEELGKIVIKILVLLAIVSVLLRFLPEDPFQEKIIEYTSVLAPYVTLLNFFVPVKFCMFCLAFFIAFKYLIKPAFAFITAVLPEAGFWMPTKKF